MTKREALRKIKHYWLGSNGKDYLRALRGLLKDTHHTSVSRPALEREIESMKAVYDAFLDWTKTAAARRRLEKAREERKAESA